MIWGYDCLVLDHAEDFFRAHLACIQPIFRTAEHIILSGDLHQDVGRNMYSRFTFETRIKEVLPDAKWNVLERNYRCESTVVQCANALMNVPLEIPLTMQGPERKGEAIVQFVAWDQTEEAHFVAEEIQFLVAEEGVRWDEIAVLFRSHSLESPFKDAFQKVGIPFSNVEGVERTHRLELEDFCQWCRLICNPNDDLACWKVLEKIHPEFQAELLALWSQSGQSNEHLLEFCVHHALHIPKPIRDSAIQLRDSIKERRRGRTLKTLEALSNWVMTQMGLEAVLTARSSMESMEALALIKLVSSAGRLSFNEWMLHLRLSEQVSTMSARSSGVVFSEFAGVKGVEFRVVFLVGMEEGIIPHYLAQFDTDAIRRERRLLYTAMTRSTGRVYLTSANKRDLYGDTWHNDLSRFVEGLPKTCVSCFVSPLLVEANEPVIQLFRDEGHRFQVREFNILVHERKSGVDFRMGDVVEHPTFGRGVVSGIEGTGEHAILNIVFPEKEMKLMAKYAPLVKV